ncbi:PhoX family protein [Fodinicola acaciae]|uniref:PhoX family protein n=1 Tax=Fodinicola acaciae TaxID=2681555 RepID=UPI0013CFABEF|nr:PhoX family phosphatase [Fodinicola acaciae]
MTCLYRCGNACFHPVPNESDNSYFADEVSRRDVFRAGALGAIAIGVGGAIASSTPASAAEQTGSAVIPEAYAATGGGNGKLTFSPIPPNTLDTVVVPNGYDHAVIIKWGDAVEAGAPKFDINRQTAAAQAKQFGYNNDFTAVLPLDRHDRRGLLVCNHEYTDENLMFPGFTKPENLTVEQLRISMAAHGLSVVEIERVGSTGQWRVAGNGRAYNRRITLIGTPFQLTGPAAGSKLLQTAADRTGRKVIGTQNNCSGGVTPWGTVLSGEENFNQYFVGGDGAPESVKAGLKRYGISTDTRYPDGNRRWDRADERFDLARHPHEAHRFGWVVEVDPYDRRSTPRKHTALGRLKHEGANVILTKDGRAAVYTGDDERFEYLYKFVSDKKMIPGQSSYARKHNMTLLESGTLYVATFDFTSAGEIDGSGRLPSDGGFNGTGRWIPLVKDGQSMVPGMTVDEVLVFTRLAGDKVGATKLDRPEDVEPNPVTGKVYAALTNNTDRGKAGKAAADEVNPRNLNKHGHILEITADGGDHGRDTFTWTLPIVCGDPKDPGTYFAGFDKTKVSPISCPDNVAFDRYGNLWIATDGNALGSNDGLFAVPLSGPDRGHLRQFLTVPHAAETCGPFISADNRTVFTAVQHPGEDNGASVEKPLSTWPDGDLGKPAIICTWRLDGREVGA